MAKFNIDLIPFTIPDSVLLTLPPGTKQDGFTAGPKIPLGDIQDDILHEMCDDFRTAIFERAQDQRTK